MYLKKNLFLGRQAMADAAVIESRDENTDITIYVMDGLRLYGNLHMGIAENVLNKPFDNSNAAFLIKVLKLGVSIVTDIWEQDVEKVKSAHVTCQEMVSSLGQWGDILEDHKEKLQARMVELLNEKHKLVTIFDDLMKADIQNDLVIEQQELQIDYYEKQAKQLEKRIEGQEYQYEKHRKKLRQSKAKRDGFIAAGCAIPIFGFCSWLSGGYKRRKQ